MNNLSSEHLRNIVDQHAATLRETSEKIAAQTRDYPLTYDDYRALEQHDRCRVAMTMFTRETAREPYIFDITSHALTDADSLQASIKYDEGKWVNALNETYIEKPAHLRINVISTLGEISQTSHVADFEQRVHYDETGYKNYTFSHYEFRVAPAHFQRNHTVGPEDPLFDDVVTILDTGVEALYRDRIAARIAALGSTAVR